jgi:hypothetical protein
MKSSSVLGVGRVARSSDALNTDAMISRCNSANVSLAGTNTGSTIQEEERQDDTALAALKAVSTLDAHCLRWMNKRKTGVSTGNANVKVRIFRLIPLPHHNHLILSMIFKLPPDKARQLREVFAGLDFNGGGSVDINEFKAAISYVNETFKDGSINFGDAHQINALFRAMDTDGSGDIDFGEFMSVCYRY